MTTHDELRELAAVDHPFTVHDDGRVTDADVPYVPYAEHDAEDDMTLGGIPHRDAKGWDVFTTGYTGQYGYRGPVMHPSEFIGGSLASDILSTPGTYVVALVNVAPYCEICELPVWEHTDGEWRGEWRHVDADAADHACDPNTDPEPAGWVILKLNNEKGQDNGI